MTEFAIATERLFLRRWQPEDAAAAFAFWGDPEVMKHAGGACADEAAALRSLGIGDRVFREVGVCLWPVVLRANGALIGCCGFHVHEGGPALELAFHFARAYWRQGYASEAARACLAHVAETRDRPEVVAFTEPPNTASERLLERLGFVCDGLDAHGEHAWRLVD